MNSDTKFGISNLQISIDGINYQPLESIKEVNLIASETTTPEFDYSIPESVSASITIHKKKYGTAFERYLYFRHHKKRRIRKKYNIIDKVFGGTRWVK